jgi:hypothetical protein
MYGVYGGGGGGGLRHLEEAMAGIGASSDSSRSDSSMLSPFLCSLHILYGASECLALLVFQLP